MGLLLGRLHLKASMFSAWMGEGESLTIAHQTLKSSVHLLPKGKWMCSGLGTCLDAESHPPDLLLCPEAGDRAPGWPAASDRKHLACLEGFIILNCFCLNSETCTACLAEGAGHHCSDATVILLAVRIPILPFKAAVVSHSGESGLTPGLTRWPWLRPLTTKLKTLSLTCSAENHGFINLLTHSGGRGGVLLENGFLQREVLHWPPWRDRRGSTNLAVL